MSSCSSACRRRARTERPRDCVDAVEIPAGELVELAPGGTHVMLIDLAAPLQMGD
ncbi:MAG: copper chaperone PCu(A)C [Acidimicrobiia bacterium]|nr:copper chaperone PCu(A)C [Acidimicrobiia bacterium]